MVAGGVCDDTDAVFGERQQLVEGPAKLKGPYGLKVFGFEA